MADILFICGSLNQTTMMHKIAAQMWEHRCFFTPYYADGIEDLAANIGLLKYTVLGGRHLQDTKDYLAQKGLNVDPRGESRDYELVITCSDLIVQKNIRGKRLILVQEGITEPETWVYRAVKTLKLPRYLANTSTNGLSDAYDLFCVASEGYARHFIKKGVRSEKVVVTGIPNFDNLAENWNNDFPHHGHALAVTTPFRETFRRDDRVGFIQQCAKIAAGRPLIFKLHPLEKPERARREIERYAPGAITLERGNVNHMIANAGVVITQQSTATFVAVALGKETHTYLDVDQLRELMPIQNDGTSAMRMAHACRRLLATPMPVLQQIRRGLRARPRWEADAI